MGNKIYATFWALKNFENGFTLKIKKVKTLFETKKNVLKKDHTT